MKILVLGKGAREHAFVKAFLQNTEVTEVVVSPGNAGMQAAKVTLFADDSLEAVLELCMDEAIKHVFIGAEDYLARGYTDAFKANGIKVIGPGKEGAKLEASKDFCKRYLLAADIPTAESSTFSDLETLKVNCNAHIRERPVVLKWDHLAGGKGVFICHTQEDLDNAYTAMKSLKGSFSCLVEDYLEGKEVSAFTYVENDQLYYFGSACDYKRRTQDASSPNTGGMGAFSPNNLIDEAQLEEITSEYTKRLLVALKADGIEFSGFLFWGFMLVGKTPYVLEINVRFGDPETQAILPRIENDLSDFFFFDKKEKIRFKNKSCVHLVKVDPGYPIKTGLREEIRASDGELEVFYAGVREQNNKLYTYGGRILGLSALAETLPLAREKLYLGHKQVSFAQEDFREDIGC